MNPNHSNARKEIESPAKLATDPVLQAIVNAQEQHRLFPVESIAGRHLHPIIVGVSGGADSVCLLHALSMLAPQWRLALHVAHVDHNLRPQSADDAAFVRALATKLGLPFHLHCVAPGTLTPVPGGVENAARSARHAYFHTLASSLTSTLASDAPPIERENPQALQVPTLPIPIVVAHHADDQIETVLMRLVRGSGLRGLGGIRWCTEIASPQESIDRLKMPKMRVVRPLLAVTQQQIRCYLAENRLDWVEDASNSDVNMLRNRVRHQIVPVLKEMNPNLAETIAQTAELMASEAARAEETDGAALQELTLEQSHQRLVLDLNAFFASDGQAIRRGILRLALERIQQSTGENEQISFQHIELLLRTIQPQQHASGPHPIVGNLAWTVADNCGDSRRRLSLHHADAMPFSIDHPYLDTAWRKEIRQIALPAEGKVECGNGWALHIQTMPVDAVDRKGLALQDRWGAYFDSSCCNTPVLRAPKFGDTVTPLGLDGQGKKVGDLFTDQKIPRALRVGWPLVVDGETGRVLWVSGVRMSHDARMTEETIEVIHFRWQRVTT